MIKKIFYKKEKTELIFSPYKVSDPEDPVWITTYIEIKSGEKEIIDTIEISRIDFENLIKGIKEILKNANCKTISWTNLDENIFLTIERTQEGYGIKIKITEPKKKTIDLIVDTHFLKNFLESLEKELKQLKIRSYI